MAAGLQRKVSASANPKTLRMSTVPAEHANCSTERNECNGMTLRASLLTSISELDTPTKHTAVARNSKDTIKNESPNQIRRRSADAFISRATPRRRASPQRASPSDSRDRVRMLSSYPLPHTPRQPLVRLGEHRIYVNALPLLITDPRPPRRSKHLLPRGPRSSHPLSSKGHTRYSFQASSSRDLQLT